eukprot:970818_1
MVLRGTKTRPDQVDLLDIQKHIARLKLLIDSLEEQEGDVETEISNIIGETSSQQNAPGHTQITIDKLKSGGVISLQNELNDLPSMSPNVYQSITVLIDRLEFLEKKHKQSVEKLSEKQDELSIMIQQFVCGGFAGMTARTTVAPIDRVKLLIQTSMARNNTESGSRGIMGTINHEISKGGIRAMWKGNFTNCLRVFPYAALQFATYERYKSHIIDYCESHNRSFGFVERLLSGACAGATAATLTYPLDVMRVRQAVYDDIKGPVDAIKNIYTEGGIRCFYKGWTPTLLSLAPFIATNFATFDALKSWYVDKYVSSGNAKDASTMAILGLGACAGLVAQTICYPLDTVRRSMQMPNHNYNGIRDCIYKIATNVEGNGIKSFYKGLIPNAIKIVPNNGIRFLIYSKL